MPRTRRTIGGESQPINAENIPTFQYTAAERDGATSIISPNFGCLVSQEGWSYVGGMAGNIRFGSGIETSSGSFYIGNWRRDMRDGFGRLTWPSADTDCIITFREYRQGQLVSERGEQSSQVKEKRVWAETMSLLAMNVIPRHWFEKTLTGLASECMETSEERMRANAVFEEISDALQKCPYLSVSRVMKAGSAAKETRIVEDSDLDIMVVLNDDVSGRTSKYYEYAEIAIQALSSIGSNFQQNGHLLQFYVGDLEVDMVFGQEKLHSELMTVSGVGEPDREVYCCPSRSRLEIDFVSKCDPACKELIRLTKYWRSQLPWPQEKYYPESYMLELICIYMYNAQKECDPRKMSLYDLFFQVLVQLSAFDIARITFFDECYPKSAVPASVLAQMPLILDVSYPANNLANGFDYGLLKIYALLTMSIMQRTDYPKEVNLDRNKTAQGRAGRA